MLVDLIRPMLHTSREQRGVCSKFTFGIAFLVEVEVVEDEDVVAGIHETKLLHELGLLEGVAGIDGATEGVVSVIGHDWEFAGTWWSVSWKG